MSQQLHDYAEIKFPINTDNPKYPRTILGGITLLKNKFSWKALVAMEENGKNVIRFYSWQNRKDEWKVQLSNFKIKGEFWKEFSIHIEGMRELYLT